MTETRMGGPGYDYDFEPRRRWPFVLLALAAVGVLVVVLTLSWVQRQLNPSGAPGEGVAVTVTPGMSTADIGDLLEREGVISSATVFRYYAQFTGAGSIQAGNYTVRKGEELSKVFEVLEGGASVERGQPITVPEGLKLQEIAAAVGRLPGRSAEKFLELAGGGTIRSQYQPPESTNLEGLLLPETYFVAPDEDEARILRRMVDAFDRVATELNISGGAARRGITPYQVVIVASMVEREARVPEDRGPIAQVVYNRLDKGMALQIDATVLYALGVQKDTVLFKDLEVDSPYNTYRISGLPPGPIASPGRRALEAALSPTPGPFLYYVVIEENGKHAFAETLAEHNRNIEAARRKGLN